jgi:hypothetical protein
MESLGLGDIDYESKVVDETALTEATDEEAFARESFEVLKELLQSVTVVACLQWLDEEFKPRTLTRNEAILAGLMVRCMKLHHGLLQSCSPQRAELLNFFQRGVTETAVNLRFLLEHGNDELFESFVRDALVVDKKLHERIQDEVSARDGDELLPIEERMLAGIRRSFEAAGVEMEDIDAGARQGGWSPGGVWGRYKALGIAELYNPTFGVQSHYVHGSWHDLYAYHLTPLADGHFRPALEWGVIRPQPLLAAVDVLADASTRYLRHVAPESPDRETVEDRIAFCAQKARRIAELHEEFLSGRQDLPAA